MKLSWLKYFVLVVLLGALVACGGMEEEPEPTEAPVEEATEAAEPADEPEPTEEPADTGDADGGDADTANAADASATITIWADDTRAPILADLAEGFQAEYGIALDVQQIPDINDQFPIAAPAGEGPDILILAHDRIGGFYASGLLAPIDLGGRDGEFLDTAISAFTYEGELVGMPYAVENLAFFYNMDMVDAAPASWDEAMEVGGALVESGDATYAIALTGTTYDMFPLQTAFGGYVFGRDGAGNYNPEDVGIDSDGMIAAGDFLAANIDAGLISNSTDWDTAHLQFETGEIPFLMAGPWALDRLRTSGVNYGIAGFPDGGAPFLGVQGFAVNALSDNVLLAQTFLTEFVATADVMQALADAGNRPTAFKAVTQSDADLVAFNDAGVDAQPMPAIPEMGSVWGSWGDAFTLIINGESGAADALTNGATQIRALIGGAAVGMVNVPGSWQSAAGFDCEWAPDCADTALSDNGDGTYSGTFDIPAGDYEAKVALDGAWTENYGVDGAADGDNYMFTVESDSAVTFTFDSDSKMLDIAIGGESSMMDDGGEMMADEGCGDHDMSGGTIVLHQQAGREGPLASILGDGFAVATTDVVNYINDNGGICGAELIVEFCETNYNPEMEVACYEQFRASEPKPTILFTYGSGATVALKDRVVEDQIVNFAAGLNADAFYNPADGYTFGAAPIYSDQFAGFVEYVANNWDAIKPADAGDDIVVGVIGWANAFGAGATTPEAIAYAESLGVTVLPLEEQAISPDADVSGSVQTLALNGANVIYAQNLSFGTAQVIGTIRALGLWDSFVVGGVNWTFNTDVLNILGENVAIADGYYGVFPYAWWSDEGVEGVDLAKELFAAGEYGEADRATTYLTTIDSFMMAKMLIEAVVRDMGPDAITGENIKAKMEEMGQFTGMGILRVDAADGSRASHETQIRQWKWNGESMDYTIAQDWSPLPDTRP